jgi:hypothetical protein
MSCVETSIEGSSVEVRYAGVIVGRGAVVRDLAGQGVFVGIPEPMPVGTAVTLTIGDTVRAAIVDEVVESAEPSAVGMRVRWGGAAAPALRPEAARPAPVGISTLPTPAAPVEVAPIAPVKEAPPEPEAEAGDASGPADGPIADVPIAAPLSLAGPSQQGGKKRRKRR